MFDFSKAYITPFDYRYYFQLNSYKDWFSRDWYDKIRDYEWDPNDENFNKLNQHPKKEAHVTDSVPLR